MKVSRSAYYAGRHRAPTPNEQEDSDLAGIIRDEFTKSRGTYGTRRMKQTLLNRNLPISRRRIGRLMREAGRLACKTRRKFKATTNSTHHLPVADNTLDRPFTVSKPNQVYAGDITYIHSQEGWLYLAVVIDLFSRQVVGWSMDKHRRATLVNDALLMAIWKRKPDKGLLWHSDRGSQYASDSHRKLLRHFGIRQSMSRKGNCWDNSVSESFFHTLKTELTFPNRSHQRPRQYFEHLTETNCPFARDKKTCQCSLLMELSLWLTINNHPHATGTAHEARIIVMSQ
jgi:transposase InsO family protein